MVKIKQSLTKLKQEIVQMDVRIGVVEHTLLQAKLKEKSNMTRDMHATNIPEPCNCSDRSSGLPNPLQCCCVLWLRGTVAGWHSGSVAGGFRHTHHHTSSLSAREGGGALSVLY